MGEYREECNLYKKGKHGGFDLSFVQKHKREKATKKYYLEMKYIGDSPYFKKYKDWHKDSRKYEKYKDMLNALLSNSKNSMNLISYPVFEYRIPECFTSPPS